MDFNSLKRLTSSMGEEFKVIDSVTFEAINVQRLITNEKEYCFNLESLIKTYESEISALETESNNLKCKLGDVVNKGILLRCSLESLKSSHKMVDLLKIDLKKQLKMQKIKTSEEIIKFNSVVKKYEDMWESYKVIYQKFPLVSDLCKIQSRLKKETINLSLQEKEIKDYKFKIETLISIQDERNKIVILKIAEKYMQREKLMLEKDTLEKNIRFKRESLQMRKSNNSHILPDSFGSIESVLKSDSNMIQQEDISLQCIMDSLLAEFKKDNMAFSTSEPSMFNSPTYQRYETILKRGVQSVPLLKLPPLNLLDSPPRKVRSVGNLLSPLKNEWSNERKYDTVILPSNDLDMSSLNSSTTELNLTEQRLTEEEKVKDEKDELMDVDDHKVDISESVQGKTLIDDPQTYTKYESQASEEMMDTEKIRTTFTENETVHLEKGNGEISKTNEPASNVEALSSSTQNENNEALSSTQSTEVLNSLTHKYKPDCEKDSLDFTYVPHPANPATNVDEIQNVTPELKSPYFASSYLNFMEIPQKHVYKEDKKVNYQENNPKKEPCKEKIPMVDQIEDDSSSKERKKDESDTDIDHPGRKKVHCKELDDPSFAPLPSQPLNMDVEDMNVSQISETGYTTAEEKNVNANKYRTNNDKNTQDLSEFPTDPKEAHQFQQNLREEEQHLPYESQMDYSQMSIVDSVEYSDTADITFSPDNRFMIQSPQFVPSPTMNQNKPTNIFGSPPENQSFSYDFSPHHQQPSGLSLFGNGNTENNSGKDKKQSEVFNFAFDTKSKTPTMFKLF